MSVYFIACGGFIKVGFSENPERRAVRLFSSTSRYSAPRAAYEARGGQALLGYIEGDKTTEARLHAALDDYSVGCEWFIDEPELRDYLASLTDADEFAPITRTAGPAWNTVPREECGGGNVELVMQVWANRRAQLANTA